MNFQIREAQPRDAAAILGLILELAKFELQPDAVIISQEDILEANFSENPLTFTYIAEIDYRVIGIAICYYTFSTWKGRSIHLEDLIVDQNYRQHGVGKALMHQVIVKASKENVGRLEWEVLDWNDPAINFYKNLGTTFYKDWYLCRLFREDIIRLTALS